MGLFRLAHVSPPLSCVQRTETMLVLTLMSARRPTVWQRDLTSLSCAAFDVAVLPNGGGAALSITVSNGVPDVIAEFETRDASLQAWAEIHAGLAPPITAGGQRSPSGF